MLDTAVAPPPPLASPVDWEMARAETLAHLQACIRFDTTNPPGNELPLARYLDGVLRAAGIETTLLEPTPGRAALVGRLRGTGPDSAARAVIVLAHMDVVGVERERWTTDPFGAAIRDGCLYGRGAIDDKGMLAANLMAVLLLKRHVLDAGAALDRDVVFLATSDEESGGAWGIGWLAEHHPELLRGEFAVNEGGRVRIVNGRPLYVAIQTAEKVPHVVTVTARGPGGHAAVPLEGNAVLRLGRALAAIGAHREAVQVSATTRRFFSELSSVWPAHPNDLRDAMCDVASADAGRVRRGAAVLSRTPVFNAVLRTGISATMTRAGVRPNVIPAEASATLNVRTLPGESIDAVVERLKEAVADAEVEITVTSRGADAPVSSPESPMFRALAESARELDPTLAVVPYLSTGATDNAALRRLGVQAYGILPFPLAQADEERMHAHDERIPLDSLHFGTRLLFGALHRASA